MFVCVRSHGVASGAGQQEDQGVCDGGGGRCPDGGVCVLHQTQHLQGRHLREHPQGERPLRVLLSSCSALFYHYICVYICILSYHIMISNNNNTNNDFIRFI